MDYKEDFKRYKQQCYGYYCEYCRRKNIEIKSYTSFDIKKDWLNRG